MRDKIRALLEKYKDEMAVAKLKARFPVDISQADRKRIYDWLVAMEPLYQNVKDVLSVHTEQTWINIRTFKMYDLEEWKLLRATRKRFSEEWNKTKPRGIHEVEIPKRVPRKNSRKREKSDLEVYIRKHGPGVSPRPSESPDDGAGQKSDA